MTSRDDSATSRDDSDDLMQARLSRRRILSALMAAGLVGPVLAACGGDDKKTETSIPQPQQPSGAPNVGQQPAQQTIGRLVVRSEPYPKYEGTPTDGDLLKIIRAEDFTLDMNPATLNTYSPYTFVYDPLVWIDEYTLDPKPWLAES